jgi:hypothetical protein
MKNYLFLFVAGLAFLSFGCNQTPVPVEFSKVCELQNDGSYLETTGYLDNIGDLNCSGKQGGNMKCSLVFKKDENVDIDINKSIRNELSPTEVFTIYVLLGDSANSLKKKESALFKKKEMEFIGNDNSIITLKDKVKITGLLRSMKSTDIKGNPYVNCSLNISKIEKQ